MPNLFRKKAVQNAAHPDRLDVLMTLTSRRDWLALVGILVLLSAALVWSIFGRVNVKVDGRGAMLSARGVREAQTLGAGVIDSLQVREGDVVDEGQVLVRLDLPLLRWQRQQTEAQIEDLVRSLAKLKRFEPPRRDDGVSDLYQTWQMEVFKAEGDLKQAQARLDNLEHRLEEEAAVRSAHKGRVIQVLRLPGEKVEEGEAVVVIEPLDAPMHAYAFVTHGIERVREGQPALVLPATARMDDSGFIRGEVVSVSRYPQPPSAMMRLLHNRKLVDELTASGDPYLVEIRVEEDDSNPSGLAWTVGEGPEQRTTSGTLCSAAIVTGRVSPLSLLLPGEPRPLLAGREGGGE